MFINGIGAISPQGSLSTEPLLAEPLDYAGDRLLCAEPDYGQYIEAKFLRRMSRILKMGTTSSLMALADSGTKIPNAIITGTGYGCLEDTLTFAKKIIENKEQALNPTPFIQSTHNTIGSQIALLLQCFGYNQTYTQDGFSFENSLLDALLQLNENPDQTILAGGVDALTDDSHEVQQRFGIFRRSSPSSLNLFSESIKGTVEGEGAFYFALSGKKQAGAYASIEAMTTLLEPTQDELIVSIDQFINSCSLTANEVDLMLVGKSGDATLDAKTDVVISGFAQIPTGSFKHLCGEYPTASAFAVCLAARMIKAQRVPFIVRRELLPRPLKNVLIYNPYFQHYHSLILLRSC
jgi:3-oxoacyl-[acyl-carrier-protein] synthase II